MIFLVYREAGCGCLESLVSSEIIGIDVDLSEDIGEYFLVFYEKDGGKTEISLNGCQDFAEANKMLLAVLLSLSKVDAGFVMLDFVIAEYQDIYEKWAKGMSSSLGNSFETYLKGE